MGRITLVATGGARATTQLELGDRFVADGHEVRCLATTNALRFLVGHLLGRPERARRYAAWYRPQRTQFLAYFRPRVGHVPHVLEAMWPDVVVMAPATCNSVGKLATGINDNFPLLVVRAVPRSTRVIVVPSMNTEMWHDPQLQRNIDLLNATEKYRVLCPSRGEMLSGDYGFGAQVPFEDIVAGTYRALGIAGDAVDAVLADRKAAAPRDEAVSPEPVPDAPCVMLVDGDGAVREQIAGGLARMHPGFHVEQFDNAADALAWSRRHRVSLVVTEREFATGPTGADVIEHFRRAGADRSVHVIATSAHDRREVHSELLARDDVFFQPKPLNVPFLVGMIAGCLGGQQQATPVVRKRLSAGSVLFRQGDPGSKIYVVESGRLRVVKEHNGREVTLGTVGEHATVGELAFLGDHVRSATVIADVDSELVELDLEDVHGYLADQPSWVRALIAGLADHLRRRDASALEWAAVSEETGASEASNDGRAITPAAHPDRRAPVQ